MAPTLTLLGPKSLLFLCRSLGCRPAQPPYSTQGQSLQALCRRTGREVRFAPRTDLIFSKIKEPASVVSGARCARSRDQAAAHNESMAMIWHVVLRASSSYLSATENPTRVQMLLSPVCSCLVD